MGTTAKQEKHRPPAGRSQQKQERIEKALEDLKKLTEEVKRMNPKPPKETSTDTLHKIRYGQSD